MFEPCSNSAIKINGSQNTRQDQPLTNKPCAYSPESKINCTYCDQFRLGDVPSGWELGICNPKRTILRQKISGPLPKLNFVDLQTGLEIADAQQRGCDRYDPQTRSSRIKNPQRSSNNINDLLAEKIEQRLAIAGPREGVFGEIIKDTFQIADLNEGTEVTGMTDIKDIATFLLQTIREATAKLGLRYDDRPFDYAGEIKSFLAKQGFIGPLREISPMLVINNLPNLSAESHTSGTILVQLLIEAGLFSSYQENRVDTYVGSAQVLLSRAARPKIVTKYRHLTQEDGLVQLALMLDQSRATFEAVYKERIRNAVSAGLPGSGKKRGRR